MILRDRIGNRIEEGHYVEVTVGNSGVRFVGHVLKVEQGGLSRVGAGKTPARIVVSYEMTVDVDAAEKSGLVEFPIAQLLRLVDPASERVIENLSKGAARA